MGIEVILVLICIATNISGGQSTDEWFGQQWLDENYLFKWKTNHLEKEITIRVEVMTKGWVGFGLSKHGKTTETDLVIGWVDVWGHSTFNDFWINEFGNRSLDASQDWTLLSGEENATHTILEFRRDYVTCDEFDDLEIYENDFELSNIILSFNFLDPNNIETIGEPIIEEVFRLNFFEKPENFSPKETDVQIVDNWLNVTLRPNSHDIFCTLLKNNFTESRQIIKYQPFSYYDNWKLNHHLDWFSCPRLSAVDKYIGIIFPCYDTKNSLFFIRQNCSSIQILSFLNNKPVVFPDNVGLTIDPAENPYSLIEGHLINPKNTEINAKFSLRMWLSKNTRKFQTSVLSLIGSTGILYNTFGFIVPPKQPSFKINWVSSTYCFEHGQFSETGIHIFKVLLHSHHGLNVEMRHYRNDRLTRVIKINNNDAGWQPFRILRVPINFRNGDKVVGFCATSSISENKTFTSPQEHCAALLYYYPPIPIEDEKEYSSRIAYETMLYITGLEKIDGYDTETYDNIIIRKPVKYNNTKLIDFISENKYKINDPKELEELQISSDMMECCYVTKRPNEKTKTCRSIQKPTGLYQSVMKRTKCSPKRQTLPVPLI